MKKQIIILFLFILHLSSWSQTSIITNVPCTDAMHGHVDPEMLLEKTQSLSNTDFKNNHVLK